MDEVVELAKKAKDASHALSIASSKAKDGALHRMADDLVKNTDKILVENDKDMGSARERKISSAMMDRLLLTDSRIEAMAEGLREVAALPDPVGEVIGGWRRPNGLLITRVRTTLGVIAMVYEARPNVTVDAAGLCLKAGSSALMRGGSEAIHSNIILARLLSDSARAAGMPDGAVQLVETTDRRAVMEMLKLNEYIDLVIPRGGHGLIQTVVDNSTIPVIKHFRGLTHTYVDAGADVEMATKIVNNAKAQRPSTCNALETLLVHSAAAADALPPIVAKLREAGVEVRGDQKVKVLVPDCVLAQDDDWSTEYLDLVLSIKIVDDIDQAIDHIRTYSSGLAEAIVTNDYASATKFCAAVDSAAVYVNASIRFTDGGQFGLGAEIGITTDKIFPRGPMGLEALTSSKYVIYGQGQIRE